MDEIKTTLLTTPEIIEHCLGNESCFHVIKHKSDIVTLGVDDHHHQKNAKYIGK